MTRQPVVVATLVTFVSMMMVQTAAFLPPGASHPSLSAATHVRSTTVESRQGRRRFLDKASLLPFPTIAAVSCLPSACNAFWNRSVKGRHPKGRRLMKLSEGRGRDGDESYALLLRMDFEGQTNVEELRGWIRRYPFGTALPVQPFSLVETEAGVDVVFRKKPTLERGSQDGGLRFAVEESVFEEGVDLPACPTLTMRRISEGQEIRKMFAERIVVKAIVKALAGDGTLPAPDNTTVRTVLHEGLV